MTPDELAAIKTRVDAASPGDWRRSQYTEPYTNAAGCDAIRSLQIGPFTDIKGYICCTVADAVFAIEARSDIPKLLAALEEATKLVERQRAVMRRFVSGNPEDCSWDEVLSVLPIRLPWEASQSREEPAE